jgi:predicted negative regulator of RcsB-dependent stress response
MLRFLGLLVVLAVVVIGVGFYLGWFHVTSEQTGERTHTTLTVDQDKIREDEERAKSKLQDFGRKIKESTKPATTNQDDR